MQLSIYKYECTCIFIDMYVLYIHVLYKREMNLDKEKNHE